MISCLPLRLFTTLTPRLRWPCGARMATIAMLAARITDFAIHGFIAGVLITRRIMRWLPMSAQRHADKLRAPQATGSFIDLAADRLSVEDGRRADEHIGFTQRRRQSFGGGDEGDEGNGFTTKERSER